MSRRSLATIRIPRDWSEFVASLLSHRVRFLVIGSHALAAHGRPVYTGDFDVFVEPSRRNAARLRAALAGFGVPAEAADRLAEPDKVLTMGVDPMRIDVLTGIDGVSFDEAWRGRIRARFGGRSVYVIGRDEYVKNKRASGTRPERGKDLLHLALLDEISATGSPTTTIKPLSEYYTARKKGGA